MLTKEQEKNLQSAIEDFIKLGCTSDQPYRKLCYCTKSDKFFATDANEEAINVICLKKGTTGLAWEWYLPSVCQEEKFMNEEAYMDEVEDIINNTTIKFYYPQTVIDNVKKLVKEYKWEYPISYAYYPNYESLKAIAANILVDSGAAQFIRETIGQQDARHHIADNTDYFKDLKSEIIAAYGKAKEV